MTVENGSLGFHNRKYTFTTSTRKGVGDLEICQEFVDSIIDCLGSSIVNEGIRGNFELLYFFFYEKISHAQKVQKDTYKQTRIKSI